MIQTVVKRDGRVVGYNEEKIKAAIRKAMLATDAGDDEALIQRIADHIGARGKSQMSVEGIQDMVEPARQKPAICSWKSSTPRTTISPARTPT